MKNFFHNVTKAYIVLSTCEVFGVRDKYLNGKFWYTQVSTVREPKWHRSPENIFKGPIIPLMGNNFFVKEVGDL